MTKSILLAVLLVISASASEKTLLFELHKNKFTEVARVVPNRLYAAWEPSLKTRVFKLSNEKGQFPSKGDSLMALSVLDGKLIGGDPGKRYLLEKSGKWSVTLEREDHWYFVPGPTASYYHRYPSSVK